MSSHYPSRPGYKDQFTSKAAATKIEPRAVTLRRRALDAIFRKASTADEVAVALGESVLAIRPRITELFKLGKIEPTGERRANLSGVTAKVWRVREPSRST